MGASKRHVGVKKMKPGETYHISWIDHFTTSDHSSQEAVLHEPVVMNSYGVYVGYNTNYVILATTFENLTSSNNDNTHILRRMITDVRPLG